MRCPNCNEEKQVRKNGFYKKRRRYKCIGCKASFYIGQVRIKHCVCGMLIEDGSANCGACQEPFFQYHKVDRESGLYT